MSHSLVFLCKCAAMGWTDGFIAVDWGTTNRRAYRLDERGRCLEEFADPKGVLAVAAGGFPAAAAEIRTRLGDLPMLLAGMVGSSRGWAEAPYVPCPAGLDELAASLSWIEPRRTAIVPGLSSTVDGNWDVMRGEEIQLFGAIETALIPSTSLVCHPGTHNKWIIVEDGRIADFHTVMTGEMFNLLKSQGILAEFMGGEVAAGEAFRDGVRRGLEQEVLTADLFSVRARVLLGDLKRDDAADFVSGLLIGLDLGVGLGLARGTEFIVMGRPDLARLYEVAAAEAGRSSRTVDGAEAFIAGAMAIGSRIE
jgi:2-dehydro-3-deoxygalactonokinase